MELQTLKVAIRTRSGKGHARRLRETGAVPGVLYGGDQDSVSIRMDARGFEHLLHSRAGEHAVVQLEVEDQPDLSTPALLKAVHHHPVRGDALHADFLRIRLDQRIHTTVPLRAEGRAAGVVEGGVVDHQLREIDIECLALDIPEELVVDVTPLNIGETLYVADVPVPENVSVVTEPGRVILGVLAPRVVEEEAPPTEEEEAEAEVAEGEAGEPEVIGEKRDEREG